MKAQKATKGQTEGFSVHPFGEGRRGLRTRFRVLFVEQRNKRTLAAWASVVWVAWQPPSERAQWGAGAHGAQRQNHSQYPNRF